MFTAKSSIDKLTVRMKARQQKITTEIMQAEQTSAQSAKLRAVRMSTGLYSKAVLAQIRKELGHGPYSRLSPRPPADPAFINSQTGRLARSWIVLTTAQKDGVQITLYNIAPYARNMLGTPRMIPRPILERVAQLERGPRLARLQKAQAAILRG